MRHLTAVTDGPDIDVQRVRDELRRTGVAYLRRLLPPDVVADAAAAVWTWLARSGWTVEPGCAKPADRGRVEVGAFLATGYPEVLAIERWHGLSRRAELNMLATSLLGGQTFCHPARACRFGFPGPSGRAWTTRPHQDYVVLRHTPDVLTTWIPLVDCDPACPGLWVLPGSHSRGVLARNSTMGGARPLYVDVPVNDARWAGADYRVGDVLLFHSLTLHAAPANPGGRIRLSVDFRYQRRDEPVREEFLHPHGWPSVPDWSVLTAGWRDPTLATVPPGVPVVPTAAEEVHTDPLATVAPPSRLLAGAEA